MNIHTVMKSYPCSSCGEILKDGQPCYLHTFMHTVLTPYTCQICGEKFLQEHNLKLHGRVHGINGHGNIPVQISSRPMEFRIKDQNQPVRCLKSIKPIKRVSQSMSEPSSELPIVMALNPRSCYPRVKELTDLIIQYNVSIAGVSESWERQDLPLNKLIQIDNFKVITNVCQRQNRGGKPALIIDESRYYIKSLCPNPITVPLGVEAVWALLKPKMSQKNQIFSI